MQRFILVSKNSQDVWTRMQILLEIASINNFWMLLISNIFAICHRERDNTARTWTRKETWKMSESLVTEIEMKPNFVKKNWYIPNTNT